MFEHLVKIIFENPPSLLRKLLSENDGLDGETYDGGGSGSSTE
jgi:hypothetical protein